MATCTVNGQPVPLDPESDVPLLWLLRDRLGLTGTKYGCGMALCGACTVHVDGQPVRSCATPAAAIAGKSVVTIEAVASTARAGQAVCDAWVAESVAQCGYCQSGQIMSATALLAANAHPTDAQIDAAMRGNVCRCATYPRIRAAIRRAAERLA